MVRPRVLSALVGFALSTSLLQAASAKWAMTWEKVPLKRVIDNVDKIVKKNQKDADATAVLARLHSLAYWKGEGDHDLVMKDRNSDQPRALPGFAPFDSMKPESMKGELSDRSKWHLMRAVELYQTVTYLRPNDPINYLGLGYVLHEASKHDGEYPSSKPNVFKARAIAAYRKAYELTVRKDADQKSLFPTANNPIVSREAGVGLTELLKTNPATAERDAEIRSIQAHIAAIDKIPQAITPIIFPLDSYRTLDDLLDGRTSSAFDLAGDGIARRWPWLKPDTGILVWDPERSGRIVSGRQLFGSVTWWMFWRDGYQPLAALDDNADGKLTGRELEGIAVWQDRNQDGRSDVGEVAPVEQRGFTLIKVSAGLNQEDVPAQRCGLLRNGKWLPTYDWTPTSLGVDDSKPESNKSNPAQIAFAALGFAAVAFSAARLRAVRRTTV